jgi:hypothetical protein
MLLNGAAQTEETATQFSSVCAASLSNTCSAQADNDSRIFRLRRGCQFPWCALAQTVFPSRCLVTAPNSRDSSASVLTSLPAG